MTTSDQETAKLLSDYFKEVYIMKDTCNIATSSDWSSNDRELQFSESIVIKKLQKVQTNKSSSADGIHPVLLKECVSVLAELWK